MTQPGINLAPGPERPAGGHGVVGRRRAQLSVLLAFAVMSSSALAGTLAGTVRARAAAETGGAGNDGAYGSRRYKFVERIDYDRLQDFVVSIEGPLPAAGDSRVDTVVQKDAAFEPHVLPVVAGTVVRWPNEDDIYHNVFSMSDETPFDLKLYKRGERVPEVRFEKVGRVDVFCGIHTQMHCIILVLPNPFFAKTDNRGRYTIKDVPAGTYRLKAWHERLPSRVQDVVVPAEGTVTADFVLGVGAAGE